MPIESHRAARARTSATASSRAPRRSSSSWRSRPSTGATARSRSAAPSRWRSTARRSPKTIFLDSQKPLRSFVSPVVPGYRENTCGESCEFDPAKAKALFESAGGAAAVGGRIEIAYNVDGGHKPWIDATCNQIEKNLGVECVGNPQPKFAELLTKLEKKEPVGPVPHGLDLRLPGHGELPRPALHHLRVVELLRLQQHAVRHARGRGRQAPPHRPRPPSSTSRPRTSWSATCRSSPSATAEQLRPLDTGEERAHEPVLPGRTARPRGQRTP